MTKKILWFDIETAPEIYSEEQWFQYPKRKLREDKALEKGNPTTLQFFIENSSIYPEFSKVVCISMKREDTLYSIVGEEKNILEEFNDILSKHMEYALWGFNIIGYDIPFLRKRMIINHLLPNKKLCIQNEKPRESSVVDVIRIWKHTSFGCSLDLLSLSLFGESPKSDMKGSMVVHAFAIWDISSIKQYCEGDVLYTARCYEVFCDPTKSREKQPQESLSPTPETNADIWTSTGESRPLVRGNEKA